MKYPYTSKKLAAILAAAMIMGTSATFTKAEAASTQQKPITIEVNGKALAFPDAAPYIDPATDRTMIPIRFVSEALGAAVQWDGATKMIQISKGETLINFKIEDPHVKVSGKEITLDAKPVLKNNRTYVPLRFVSEGLGSEVNWNGDTHTVAIANQPSNQIIPKDQTTQAAEANQTKILTFADALKLAEDNSIDLQKSKVDYDLTNAKLSDARDLEDVSVNDLIMASGGNSSPDNVANTKITKELSLKLAQDGLMILDKTMDYQKLKLKKDLEEALLTYIAGQDALKIAQGNESQANKSFQLMKKKFELGVITHSELLQAETLYSQSQLGVQKSQVDISVARKNINNLLNQPLDQAFEIKDHTLLEQVDLLKYNVDSLLDLAKQQRPDYVAQVKKVETEKAKYDIYLSTFRNKYNKNVESQWATYQKEELTLKKLEQDMRLQLSTLLENINLVKAQVTTAEKNTANLQEVVRVTEAKVQSGMGVELELLSSQIKLMEAEKAQVDSKYNLAKLYRTLFFSIGQELTKTTTTK